MKKIFTGQKVATAGVREKLGAGIELILWNLVEEFAKEDPFIIIEIEGKNVRLSQEQPERMQKFNLKDSVKEFIPNIDTIRFKLWAIDNEEYCTLLFPEEY